MKIRLLAIGKTTPSFIKEGILFYQKRLSKYISFTFQELRDLKNTGNLSVHEIKDKEADIYLKHIADSDFVVVLDERGVAYRSVDFAKKIEHWMLNGVSNITFIIGGAWGCSDKLKKRANLLLRVSDMTFSHQIARILFLEQLYRAYSIINGSPYHNE